MWKNCGKIEIKNMVKVIILYNKIFHYRVPVWNCLAEKCDLTVSYSDGDGKIPEGLECKFKIIYLPKKQYGKFVIQECNIRKLTKNYDVVIAYGDIAWIKFSTLPWFNKTKVIFHTLGVSASYGKGYDEHKRWDRIRKFFYSKADALAFYTMYPIEKYSKMGIPREKMFEAPNTVAVSQCHHEKEKDTILFIGTLYKEKGIESLLNIYKKLKQNYQLPVLNIIGNGPEFNDIKEWVDKNGLQNMIQLKGAIYDINEKAKYFAKALACISPKQAGLTVLESMGYGVPFITTKDAITGGELFNVHNNIDGIIVDEEKQFEEVIVDISQNPQKYIKMGEKAQKFYNEFRTPYHMAQGLWDAVQYALSN
ncbi:MAG: glycosyltransferase family 4 protein [Lentimicrobiaceae bacterium]|nr:glycosyltransferase family 4 protein [Lentimicrobiaceae bacterium]